eukprot:TRINITY_DN11081_c0_g1_i4.p1 TRINITY_DN11081_c0_g1~~TRINITY_DN11081_c0_g1_i4.p1  ORF type:complete len:126 (-),score=30.23 TRINITY_DN11081_c0_g1_i4:125-502(-)
MLVLFLKRKYHHVDTEERTPMVGRGEVQDVKPKPGKNGSTEGTPEETSEGNINGLKLEMIKGLMEAMKLKLSEGKLTIKEFTDWLLPVMDIVGLPTPGDKGNQDSRPSEHGEDYYVRAARKHKRH